MRKLLMILYCLALCMQGLAIGEGIATDLSEVEYGEIASALTEETVPDLGETVLWTDEMAMDEREAAPEVMAAESSESAYVPKTVPVEISPATFPDADFRDYVYDNYDLDGDGMLSEYEINEATSLSIGYVSSLEGIRYLNRLQYIDIYQIDFEGATLDLSGMTSLISADFYKCWGGTLNFSGCSSLTQLSVYYCGCDLNISDCVALYWLNCGLNGCTIDISDCPFLIKAVRDGKRTDAVEGEDRVDYRPVTYQYGEYTLYVDEQAAIVTSKHMPTGVSLNKKGTVKLKLGKTLRLTAKIKPETAASILKWKSSDKSVAEVSSGGIVTPKKPGKTTITVKTSNGKKAKVKIEVPRIKPKKVEITKGAKATMCVGDKLQLKTKLSPAGASSKLTWSTSNVKVATVSDKGLVKGKKTGTATITVKTENGKKATIKITVKKKVVDLADFYGQDIYAVGKKLGISVKKKRIPGDEPGSTIDMLYCENSSMSLSGFYSYGIVEYIDLKKGTDYSVCGVKIGSDFEKACDKARKFVYGLNHSYVDEYDYGGDDFFISVGLNAPYNSDMISQIFMRISQKNGKVSRVYMDIGGA